MSSNRPTGASSNLAFLKVIVRAIGNPVNTEDHLLSRSAADVPVDLLDDVSGAFLRRPADADNRAPEGPQKATVEPFALPSPNEAEHLLRLYFITVNLMVPCIHEESFRAVYRRLRSDGPRAVRSPWLGILNMLFAIATNVSTPTSPPPERAARSNMYFERAVKLVQPGMWRAPSLEMGMYL